jgi:lipooligosaccharide transport system ATP-binding protein
MNQTVHARGLVKRFGDLEAVSGIDLDIFPGECFGFLGANGAGKTSIMRMISCVSPVSEGDLWVNGKDVKRDGRRIREEIGVVSQEDNLDSNLSVLQNLQVHSRYFNMEKNVAKVRSLRALELFQLRDRADSNVDELSGGMRRRLLIARALLQQPKLLILDEPTTGLDPQARHMVWQRIQLLKSQQITIILSTHYMEEAKYLCDRLAVMNSGSIVAHGTPEELINKIAGTKVTEIHVGLDTRIKEQVMNALVEKGIKPEDGGERVLVYQPTNISPDFEYLEGFKITQRDTDLEDVFLLLTGTGLQED